MLLPVQNIALLLSRY